MVQLEGILLALCSAFFFGIFIIPRKTSKLSAIEYQFSLSLSLPFLAFIYLLMSKTTFQGDLLGILSGLVVGILWCIAATAYSKSADIIGITRSSMVKNFGPVSTTVWGILLFQEFTLDQPMLMFLAIIGSLLMFLATIVIARCKTGQADNSLANNPNLSQKDAKVLIIKGYLFALCAGLLFGFITIPMQTALKRNITVAELLFWITCGALISSIIIYSISTRRIIPKLFAKDEMMRGFLAAVFWICAYISVSKATLLIPMGVSWPITNLSALITLFFAVKMYKEFEIKKSKTEIFIGCFLYILGIIALGYSVG